MLTPRPIVDRHLRAVLDTAYDGVLVECGDRIAYVNPSYARLLGYPSTTELWNATIAEIAHPDDLDRLRWFSRCRAAGKPAPARYTFRAQTRSGEVVTFDATVSQTRIDGDLLITTVVRPVEPQLDDDDAADLTLPGLQRLSDRENEVVRHILAGRRSKEIAILLGISEKTIFTHRSRAFQKLAVRGERDLFRLAAEAGMISGN